jgi:hypothetical protein
MAEIDNARALRKAAFSAILRCWAVSVLSCVKDFADGRQTQNNSSERHS